MGTEDDVGGTFKAVLVDELSSLIELLDDLFRSDPWLVRLVGDVRAVDPPLAVVVVVVGGFVRVTEWSDDGLAGTPPRSMQWERGRLWQWGRTRASLITIVDRQRCRQSSASTASSIPSRRVSVSSCRIRIMSIGQGGLAGLAGQSAEGIGDILDETYEP